MQQTPKGAATLGNIWFDLSRNRIDAARCAKFHDEIARLWEARSVDDPSLRVDNLVERVVSGSPADFVCQCTVRLDPSDNCSRTMDALDFLSRNIDYVGAGWHLDEDVEGKIKTLSGPKGLGILAMGEMRTRLPFAWVTKTQSLDSLRESVSSLHSGLASRVRDALGLYNFSRDELLVEIRYPAASISNLRAPTFLEGGTSMIFRSAHGHDSWGRTVDLADLRDGLPEAVHSPVSFTADFIVREIGRLTGVNFSMKWSDLVRWTPCAGCDGTSDTCALEERLV